MLVVDALGIAILTQIKVIAGVTMFSRSSKVGGIATIANDIVVGWLWEFHELKFVVVMLLVRVAFLTQIIIGASEAFVAVAQQG